MRPNGSLVGYSGQPSAARGSTHTAATYYYNLALLRHRAMGLGHLHAWPRLSSGVTEIQPIRSFAGLVGYDMSLIFPMRVP